MHWDGKETLLKKTLLCDCKHTNPVSIKLVIIAGCSSLEAYVAHNHKVVGSNPTPAISTWALGLQGVVTCLAHRKTDEFNSHKVHF